MFSWQNPFTASHETEKFLCDRLLDQNQPISARVRALLSLRNLRGPGPRNALITATRDSSKLLAHQAAFALGHMQDVDAIPTLKAILNDFSLDPIVRLEGAEALGAIGLEDSLILDPAQEVELALKSVQQRKNAAQAGSIAPAPKRTRFVVQTQPRVLAVNSLQPVGRDLASSSRGKGKEVEAAASQEMMPPPTGRTEDTPAAAFPDFLDDLEATVKFVEDSILPEHDRIYKTLVMELLFKAEYHHAMQNVLLMRGVLEKYGQPQHDSRKGRQEAAKAEKTITGLTAELEALRKAMEEKEAELVQKGIELGEIASKAVQEYKESGELQEQFTQEYVNGFEALRSAAAAEYPDRDFSRFHMVDDQATSSQVPTSEGRNVNEEVSSYIANADPQLPPV